MPDTSFVCGSDSTDGIEFFWSENDVLLTAGNAEGKIQPKYFSRALRLRPTSKKNPHADVFDFPLSWISSFTKFNFCSREPPATAVVAENSISSLAITELTWPCLQPTVGWSQLPWQQKHWFDQQQKSPGICLNRTWLVTFKLLFHYWRGTESIEDALFSPFQC